MVIEGTIKSEANVPNTAKAANPAQLHLTAQLKHVRDDSAVERTAENLVASQVAAFGHHLCCYSCPNCNLGEKVLRG